MTDISFASAVVILLLVTDPIGNIPLFVSLLRHVAPKRRVRVIVRECAIALAVLLICVPFGSSLLELFGLSERSLNLAGGVILFLIALRMIFHGPEGIFGDTASGEPFIVPLAIPSIAGPAAIATVILLVSRAPQRLPEWLLAVTAAMAARLVVLVFAERIRDRKSTRLNSSHHTISYADFCLKKKKNGERERRIFKYN